MKHGQRNIEPLPIYPEHTLKEKLRADATENHRSLNGQVLFILEQYFKQQEAGKQ